MFYGVGYESICNHMQSLSEDIDEKILLSIKENRKDIIQYLLIKLEE